MSENEKTPNGQAAEKLRELIMDIRVAMVTTVGANGELHARPMYAQQALPDGDLWFATSRASSLVEELRHRARVLVTFANPNDQRYVVVRGEGYVHHDTAKIEELWNPGMKAWFPAGHTDPDLTLVRVQAERADFWDSPSAPVRLVQFVTALATGSRPHGGERVSVDLTDAVSTAR